MREHTRLQRQTPLQEMNESKAAEVDTTPSASHGVKKIAFLFLKFLVKKVVRLLVALVVIYLFLYIFQAVKEEGLFI